MKDKIFKKTFHKAPKEPIFGGDMLIPDNLRAQVPEEDLKTIAKLDEYKATLEKLYKKLKIARNNSQKNISIDDNYYQMFCKECEALEYVLSLFK